ncbi:conserved hypothetical protein [Talaromyces stipitatus ATCC 10500]|uniref:Uncharacterized protein n=1 Tax=Talaromyces stipitatus (strain ATCC 10500 / CBS 375.48 / QM 6759 / NRRL 1006) TaxID=441959 RepID=B8M442_TALSN|nr:uncharacterized protein TSTA_039790 [Talaromyces stipitatus ATCC 10500]EED20785.1 conserved hypothetical protein [Talaromyces stipitatus ATCC 10500]
MDTINKTTKSASEHTEEQKQHFYNNLPVNERENKSYTEWVREAYQEQYEKWMPWIEDQYLKWFGKGDNKASYATKDTLNKSKVTGVSQIDQLQDDVHNVVGNQLGENGIAAPIGNLASKEGINRAQRNGKNEKGSYGSPVAGYTDSMISGTKNSAQYIGNSISGSAKNAASYMGLGSGSSQSKE